MESIIVIVGFLGSGKTTLLKNIVKTYLSRDWLPFVILNDYENANVDAQTFMDMLNPKQINALSGSCICCSGIDELRDQVNNTPIRDKGITLIEANGTTDAVSLMSFLGVGMKEHFLPPVQIAVVDVRLWQERGHGNELEANQVQVSSIIVLNYTEEVDSERLKYVEESLRSINPKAELVKWNEFDINSYSSLEPFSNVGNKLEHKKAHWSSCSVELPDPICSKKLGSILKAIPSVTLRVKGCTRLDSDVFYTHFERTPSMEIYSSRFDGRPATGAKLLTIGPGSDPEKLLKMISESEPTPV